MNTITNQSIIKKNHMDILWHEYADQQTLPPSLKPVFLQKPPL